MIATAGRWTATTASVRGASHVRTGLPNQDAVRVVEVHDAPTGLVAAVCDGHGGERYVRSEVGSRLGTEVACQAGADALRRLGQSPEAAMVEHDLAEVVAPAIVELWTRRVLADVERRQWTTDEVARAGCDPATEPLVAYGCTLVLAILGPAWIGFLQIGDGDVVVAGGASSPQAPMPVDDRLVGGETTSLCLPSAVSDARVRALAAPLPDLVILASDGYANSFADDTWRDDVTADLRRHLDRIGVAGIDSELTDWLSESAHVGGDDVSMALLHLTDEPTRPATPDVVATHDQGGREVRTRTARRTALVVVVAVAVVAATWWLLRGTGRDDSRPSDGTAASVATTAPPAPSPTAPRTEREGAR